MFKQQGLICFRIFTHIKSRQLHTPHYRSIHSGEYTTVPLTFASPFGDREAIIQFWDGTLKLIFIGYELSGMYPNRA